MDQPFVTVGNNQRSEISPVFFLTLKKVRLNLPLNLCQEVLDIAWLNYPQ